MYYESSDFLETADSDTLKQIARTRELTREYYFSDYRAFPSAACCSAFFVLYCYIDFSWSPLSLCALTKN